MKRSLVIDHAGICRSHTSVTLMTRRATTYPIPHEPSRIEILMRFDEYKYTGVRTLLDELDDLGEVFLVVVTLFRLHSDPGDG